MLADQLTTVVGVETYNDFRNITFQIYVDRCGVVMIDATLVVTQFGIPVAPPIDGATVDAIRSQTAKPLVQPAQGANQGEDKGDDDLYDEGAQLEENEAFWEVWNG